MSLIVNIDTAHDTAFVCISENGKPLIYEINDEQKNHAAFVHQSIQKMFNKLAVQMSSLDAVAVAIGPGSYTGLRVGLSSAKGICYAIGKPLLTIGSLEMIAKDVILHSQLNEDCLICPMIDARRMEVFTALFDEDLQIFKKPEAKILDDSSYATLLSERKIFFSGSGSAKFEKTISHTNAIFCRTVSPPVSMSSLAHQQYQLGLFSSVSGSEPFYIKDYKAF